MVLIKGVEKDPELGVKFFNPSIYDDSKVTDSDKEGNNDEYAPKTAYDGENMNASSDDRRNNDEVSPNLRTNDVNINANPDDEKQYYDVTPHTPTNRENNETIDNDEETKMKKRLGRKQKMKT